MRWIRPHHTRWLAVCVLGVLISSWAGGFSLGLLAMVVVIFAAGAALIVPDTSAVSRDEQYPGAEPAEELAESAAENEDSSA